MSQSFMHASAWTQAPPFAGPPPMPVGVNIHPSDWAKGSWSFNPSYRSSAATQQQAWAPAPSWRISQQQQVQQQQQQANFNPYKRQPKPPSAEYLATKLSDNPLGLTDMVPRKELFGAENAATPWQWNPRELDEDEDEDGESTDSSDEEEPTSHRLSDPSSSRQSTSATLGAFRPPDPRTLTRHSSEPPPTLSSIDPTKRGVSSASAAAAAAAANRNASQQRTPTRHVSEPTEAFTSKVPLRPTFSPNIIRTPEYYQARLSTASMPSSNRGSLDAQSITTGVDQMSLSQSSSSKPLGRHSSLPPSFQSERVSQSSRRSRTHEGPIDGDGPLVDEPESLLSPLIIDKSPTPHVSSSRPLARGGSMPVTGTSTGLDTIQEQPKEKSPSDRAASSPHHASASNSHHRSSSKGRKHSSSSSPTKYAHPTSGSAQPSPTASRQHTPHHTPPSSAKHSHQTTPPSGGHSHSTHNPLPTPPQESSYINSIYGKSSASASAAAAYQTVPGPSPTYQHVYQPQGSSSASASASRHYHSSRQRQDSNTPSPPQGSSAGKVRKGYWNNRGDHLIGGYIVYAPSHRIYPRELKDYPTNEFKDHKGKVKPCPPNPQELPESLPRKGRPPERPYDSFVTYASA